MKSKISIIVLSVLAIVLITGCGNEEQKLKEQKLVCTTTQTEDGMSFEQVISMTYKDDKLKHMTMEVNTKINDQTVQENWEAFKESMNGQNKEFDKDGVSLKVSVNDKNYEYKVTLDVDVENASEEALEEQGLSDLKEDDSTLESSKEAAEKDGAICVIE